MSLTTGKKERKQGLTAASGVRSPFWPINRLQNQFDQLFENCFDRCLEPTGAAFASCMPNVDVFEDNDKVVVKTEIPGMKKDEIEVYLTGNFLNISGEHKEETDNKSGATQKVERYFGRFHRCVSLPAEVDSNKIQAHYKAGVLTVKCPKTAGAKQKEMEIKIN